MTRDRRGQSFVPGFLEAAATTPLETAGELPGDLFASCTRAAEAAQSVILPDLDPQPLDEEGQELPTGARKCARCGGPLSYAHTSDRHRRCARA